MEQISPILNLETQGSLCRLYVSVELNSASFRLAIWEVLDSGRDMLAMMLSWTGMVD